MIFRVGPSPSESAYAFHFSVYTTSQIVPLAVTVSTGDDEKEKLKRMLSYQWRVYIAFTIDLLLSVPRNVA